MGGTHKTNLISGEEARHLLKERSNPAACPAKQTPCGQWPQICSDSRSLNPSCHHRHQSWHGAISIQVFFTENRHFNSAPSTVSKIKPVVERDSDGDTKEVEYRGKREKRGQAALASSREWELHKQLPTNRLSPMIPVHKQATRLWVSTSLPHLSPNPREKQQLLVVYGHLEPCSCTLSTWHPCTPGTTLYSSYQ